jgi:hypothetical protein
LTWPITISTGSPQPMVLTFSGSTTGIRVFLDLTESPNCDQGLDSDSAAQQGTWP